jgi:hypothetical protein
MIQKLPGFSPLDIPQDYQKPRGGAHSPINVMAGLDPAIHEAAQRRTPVLS